MKTPVKCKSCVNLWKGKTSAHCCWLGIPGKSIDSCHSHCKVHGYVGYKEREKK